MLNLFLIVIVSTVTKTQMMMTKSRDRMMMVKILDGRSALRNYHQKRKGLVHTHNNIADDNKLTERYEQDVGFRNR